ncbi:hypothetical protein CFC21_055457 [Triticum aestivum]|uniref:Pectinesterase inhibitor domain-containing protein n=2 Tax=Triticum aestivum TaxID=4565 RepID=A0A3B6I6P4_WHEAT|nr:hypothetical protein CFC21_055457 [Triticum aestivum]
MATSHMITIVFSAIVFMLLSPAIAAQSSGDVGGKKPKPNDFMVEACKNASANSLVYDEGSNNVTQEFCISTLRSDNRSADAKNLRDLALIPVDILKERVVIAGGNVKEMLHKTKNSTSPMARNLRICELGYGATVGMLNLCGTFLRDYEGDNTSEDYDGPLSFELYDCVDDLNVCDYCGRDTLLRMPGAEALVREKDEVHMLINLGMALLSPYRLEKC